MFPLRLVLHIAPHVFSLVCVCFTLLLAGGMRRWYWVSSEGRALLLPVRRSPSQPSEMIIRGRSPSRRHFTRTRRVNLDRLFGRNPNADVLTKGSFTRERWTQLTQLFTLMTPQMHSCSHSLMFSSVQKDDKMSKCLPELITERRCRHAPSRAFGCVEARRVRRSDVDPQIARRNEQDIFTESVINTPSTTAHFLRTWYDFFKVFSLR